MRSIMRGRSIGVGLSAIGLGLYIATQQLYLWGGVLVVFGLFMLWATAPSKEG